MNFKLKSKSKKVICRKRKRERDRDIYLWHLFEVWLHWILTGTSCPHTHTQMLANAHCIMRRELDQNATLEMAKTIFIYLQNICVFAKNKNQQQQHTNKRLNEFSCNLIKQQFTQMWEPQEEEEGNTGRTIKMKYQQYIYRKHIWIHERYIQFICHNVRQLISI